MVEISGGMYGLAEAGRLAQDRLIAHLDIHGYYEAANTPCLFKHRTRSTIFSLVVDDFGIKYRTQTDADHLLATLRLLYNITVDVTGSQYLGMTILYNKSLRIFQTSMPGAVSSYLKRYQFTPLVVSTDAPSQYTAFKYGSGHLDALPVDSSPLLDAARTTRLQSIVGSFQHYARVIDVTMLCPISKLATARKSEATERAVDHFMHYAATWPNPVITYHPSNMVLQVHSDASYLSETEARSRAGGYHFLGTYNHLADHPPNGSVENVSTIIDVVCSNAMEAEAAAIFINAQKAVVTCQTLADLGYPQTETSIVSDNLVGVNILTGKLPPKRARSMDMRFYWIKDRIKQKQFRLIWLPGKVNLADYLTKTHPLTHYRKMRSTYVSDAFIGTTLARATNSDVQFSTPSR